MKTTTESPPLLAGAANRDFTIDDSDRRVWAGKGDLEIAAIRATACGHVRRMQNPLAVVAR